MNLKKYKGHTSDWKWIDINEQDDFYLHSEHGDIINHDTPDGKLAQDAPLLLEEVKRLRLLFRELINDMSADDYIEWCNRIGCPDGLELEVRKED